VVMVILAVCLKGFRMGLWHFWNACFAAVSGTSTTMSPKHTLRKHTSPKHTFPILMLPIHPPANPIQARRLRQRQMRIKNTRMIIQWSTLSQRQGLQASRVKMDGQNSTMRDIFGEHNFKDTYKEFSDPHRGHRMDIQTGCYTTCV
jgi:hypothetical protein